MNKRGYDSLEQPALCPLRSTSRPSRSPFAPALCALLIVYAVWLVESPSIGAAEAWNFQAKLTAPGGGVSNWFGYRVAIDGNYVAAGGLRDDDIAADSGAIHIFTRSGTNWTQQTKLKASDAQAGAALGSSVAMDGTNLIAGAAWDDANGTDSGSAYVFVRNGTNWEQQAKLTPSDGAASNRFGYTVAIDGTNAVVTADQDDDKGTYSGSAYVFARSGTNWTQQAKLTASDGAASDYFGRFVAIQGTTVVVGAYAGGSPTAANCGSAYVFMRSGTNWTQQQELLPTNGVNGDRFSIEQVGIAGDYVVVGANGDDGWGTDSGAITVFKRSGGAWNLQKEFAGTNSAGNDFLGSVSIDGEYVCAGAYRYNKNEPGSAYIFRRLGTNWVQQAEVNPYDGANGDWFGINTAIDGTYAVIGSCLDDDNGLDSGSVYIYYYNPPVPEGTVFFAE